MKKYSLKSRVDIKEFLSNPVKIKEVVDINRSIYFKKEALKKASQSFYFK